MRMKLEKSGLPNLCIKTGVYNAIDLGSIWGQSGVNILLAAFTPAYPQSVRTQSSHQYHFMLLRSIRVKAARKTLMKFTPFGQFHQR